MPTPDKLMRHEVQPGFNRFGIDDPIRALTVKANFDIFDEATQEVLRRHKPFVLVLGEGFEAASIRAGFADMPCSGLASTEQLGFLKQHGMQQIEMRRIHGTLAQNARALGIEVAVREG